MANWLTTALDKAKKSLGFKDAGSSEEKCPLKETGLIVVVGKEDPRTGSSEPVAGVIVDIKGKTPFNKKTNSDGVAAFKPVEPDSYSIKLKLDSSLAKQFDTPADGNQAVALGDCPVYMATLTPIVNLVTPVLTVDREEAPPKASEKPAEKTDIHIFRPEPKKSEEKPEVIAVKLTYNESHPEMAFDKGGFLSAPGSVTFWGDANCNKKLEPKDGKLVVPNGELKAGKTVYVRGEAAGSVSLTLTLETTTKPQIKLAPEVNKSVAFKSNRITPQITVEHLIVLRDQECWKEQRKNDTFAGSAAAGEEDRIHPDPTWIDLAAVQDGPHPSYKGKGTLTCSPTNVKFFEDEQCKKAFDASQPIDFEKLTTPKPLRLWMRGDKAGKFKVELKLDASNDPALKIDDPAKGELGSVELKLKFHHYKKDEVNKAINPDVNDFTTYWNELKGLKLEQAEMTKAERLGSGRILHVQKDKNHCRAKLVLEKVDGSHWPDAAKDYEIVLDAADGDKKNKKRSGGIKLFDAEQEGSEKALPHKLKLSAAKAAETTLWIEGATECKGWREIRVSAGVDRPEAGPEKKARMDADWAALTVIKIKEVKCDVDNIGGQEKFLEGAKLFTNLDNNGRLLKSVSGKRKAEVTAEISPKLKDVELHFLIVEHSDNYKITSLPADFKEKKIANLAHKLKPVDRDDRKKLLHMTAKTDDQGKAKIETLKTPQLGLMKFKVGAYHLQDVAQARYVEEHPDLKKHAPVMSTTWLEIWQRIFYRVAAMKRWSGTSYLDRFDDNALVQKMADTGIKLESSLAAVEKDYDRALPHVLNWSRTALGGNAPARTMYLCLINGRGDKGDLDQTVNLGAPTFKLPSWTTGYYRFRSTTDQAKWLTHCKVTYDGTDHDLAGVTTLQQVQDFKFKVSIDFTALWNHYKTTASEAKANDFLANGAIELKIKEADSSSGVSWGEAVVVCMDTREPDHATENAKDSASHTFLHEIGHYVGLAGKFLPDASDTVNPNFYSETAGEVSARGKGGYGVGPHCDGLSDQCIMWYMFKMTLEYCDMCKLFMRARALDNPKVDARAKF